MVKKQLFNIIRYSHLLFAKKRLPKNIALYFHNIEGNNLPVFKKILQHFGDLGYKTTDPITYQKNDDEKKLFISFDDNYKNWLKISRILYQVSSQAVFYINTSPLSDKASESDINKYFKRIDYSIDKRTLSSKDVKSIYSDFNQIIGGHSVNHFNLTKISYADAKYEILQNKIDLEEIIGNKVIHFSYPYGMRRHFNQELRNYCSEIGYQTVCNAIPGLLNEKIERFNIYRTKWNFKIDFKSNLENLRVRGGLFEKITGRSAIG